MDNEVWLEFSFVIDKEGFTGEIYVSRKVQGPVTEEMYEAMKQEVIQDFTERYVILERSNQCVS